MMISITNLLASLFMKTADTSSMSMTAAVAVAVVLIRLVCTTGASRMGYLSSKEVKKILRKKIFVLSAVILLVCVPFIPVSIAAVQTWAKNCCQNIGIILVIVTISAPKQSKMVMRPFSGTALVSLYTVNGIRTRFFL